MYIRKGELCSECLEQAKEIIIRIKDNIQDLGYKETYSVYGGRRYHLIIQDEQLLHTTSTLSAEIVNYLLGVDIPQFKD